MMLDHLKIVQTMMLISIQNNEDNNSSNDSIINQRIVQLKNSCATDSISKSAPCKSRLPGLLKSAYSLQYAL